MTIRIIYILIDINKFEGYEWAEGLSKDDLYDESNKRGLKSNEFEYLWELNGYSLIEPKETSLVGYIVSNAIYWIIGLSIMYLAASAFG